MHRWTVESVAFEWWLPLLAPPCYRRFQKTRGLLACMSTRCLVLSSAIQATCLINGLQPLILFGSSTSSHFDSFPLQSHPLIFSFSFKLVTTLTLHHIYPGPPETEDLWENGEIKAHKYNWLVQAEFCTSFVIKNKVGTNEREIIFFLFFFSRQILLRVAS